jgi:hypothetical protein
MPQVEASHQEAAEAVLALPDLEHAKTAVLNRTDVCQRSANLRPRHPRVRQLVLFGAASRFHRTVVLRYRIHLEQRDMRRPRSTSVWPPSGASRTRRPTPAS